MKNKITVVIVTYNNIPMLKELLSDLTAQTRPPEKIIVVDNASTDSTQSCLISEYKYVQYMRLAENTGSSGGYCAGLKAALPESDLILTLDDDLRLERDMLEELEKSFEQFNKTGKVSAVRATVRGGGRAAKEKFWAFAWRGTLFNASAIKEVGLPADDFFIYGEELEYSLRLNKAGYSFFWAPSSRYFNPRLGDKKNCSVLGKTFMYYTEPPRLYYSFRNELFVYLKHGCFLRALRMFLYAGKVIFWMACFDRKFFLPCTKAILHGLCHGACGIRGKVF
jgi:rhamnopyranosyl-N-acetylglucosaminyl-diphospho-decaprenol beta-1,3/1,4-galactofuranosyltransferase